VCIRTVYQVLHPFGIVESEISSDDEVVEDHSAALYDRFISEVYADFTPVRVLNVGDSFGEIALVTRSKRTATIVCREDCDFMILSKQSFDKILGTLRSQYPR
jgi:CRP-like cAMP-binding protein